MTWFDYRVAQSLVGKDHLIKGNSVHIGLAAPKPRNTDDG